MRYFLGLMLIAPSWAALSASPANTSMPDWMTGAWSMTDRDRWGDEYWTPPRGGMMIGAARTGRGDTLIDWEHTRIASDDECKLAFWAMPRGRPATKFCAGERGVSSVTFYNAANDYPQRIRYWRDGKLLKAEISLLDGSKAIAFTYAPMGNSRRRNGK